MKEPFSLLPECLSSNCNSPFASLQNYFIYLITFLSPLFTGVTREGVILDRILDRKRMLRKTCPKPVVKLGISSSQAHSYPTFSHPLDT